MNLQNKPFFVIVFISLSFLFPGIGDTKVVAQVRRDVEKMKPFETKAMDETRWMMKNLSLNADQYDRAKLINFQYARRVDSIEHVHNKLVIDKIKKQIKSEKESQFRSILSDEQYSQYTAHREINTSKKKSPFKNLDDN